MEDVPAAIIKHNNAKTNAARLSESRHAPSFWLHSVSPAGKKSEFSAIEKWQFDEICKPRARDFASLRTAIFM